MPSTSAKQAKFMRAVAHSPKFAKKVGVPQSVGKDYEMADKKKGKFGSGGPTNVEPKGFKPIQRFKLPDAKPLSKAARDTLDPSKAVARGNRMQAEEAGESKVMKKAKGGSCYAKGGKSDKAGRALVKKSADTMGRAMKFAKGGSASARADGVAKKGKTKGKMLAVGGMADGMAAAPRRSLRQGMAAKMGMGRPAMGMGPRPMRTAKKGGKMGKDSC